MGVIYLVRHGKALDGLPSRERGRMEDSYDHLSDLGHQQATATGRALRQRLTPTSQDERGLAYEGGDRPHAVSTGHDASETAPVVIAGPLRRQQDTAKRIAEEIGSAEVRTDRSWLEFDSDDVVAPYLERHRERAEQLLDLEPAACDRLLGKLIGEALDEWVHTSGFEDFRAEVRAGLARAQEQAEAAGGCAIVVTSGGPIALAAVDSLGLPKEVWPRFAGRVLTASVTVLSYSDRGAGAGAVCGAGVDAVRDDQSVGRGSEASDLSAPTLNMPTLLSFNEHAHLDIPDADGKRPLRRFR